MAGQSQGVFIMPKALHRKLQDNLIWVGIHFNHSERFFNRKNRFIFVLFVFDWLWCHLSSPLPGAFTHLLFSLLGRDPRWYKSPSSKTKNWSWIFFIVVLKMFFHVMYKIGLNFKLKESVDNVEIFVSVYSMQVQLQQWLYMRHLFCLLSIK